MSFLGASRRVLRRGADAAWVPIFALVAGTSWGADWPMWGGSVGRNMVNDVEKGIPTRWDVKRNENVRWTAALGSQTYGNPVVAGGRILIGTNNGAPRNPAIQGDKGILMCFREVDGAFQWQAVHDKLESGRANDWPEVGICSTPAVEEKRVYYVSNRAELVCADAEGFLDGQNDGPLLEEKYRDALSADFIWVLDMIRELRVYPHNQATSSPLVLGDLVYVLTSNGVEGEDHETIPSPDAPSLIAVEKGTGKVAWRSAAPGRKILHGQWSSPAVVSTGGEDQIVFPGGDGILRGFEPRRGEILWQFDCNRPGSVWSPDGSGDRNELIATPVCAEGRVYIGSGQDPENGEGPGRLCAVDASKRGDITAPGLLWERGGDAFHRTLSSVAVKGGLVFAADMSGFMYCLDAATGEELWKDDLLAVVWGSPAWIDGKVYIGDEDGDVAVYEASPTLRKLGEYNMGSSVYSTPIAANGRLYIASRKQLFALGSGPSEPVPSQQGAAEAERAAADPSADETEWPSFRGGPSLEGRRSGRVANAPALIWTFDAKAGSESTPAIADGRVFLGTEEGLLALELDARAKEGKEAWRRKLDAGVKSSPLFAAGRVHFGDDEGIFRALDGGDGREVWKYDTESGSEIISSANLAGDRVLFGSYDGSLYCLALADGKLLWKRETEGPVHASPAIAGPRTFVAGCDGQLHIVDIGSGGEVASVDLGAQAGASPAVLGDLLFVGTMGSQFHCVDWRAAKVVWTYENPERQLAFNSSAAVGPAGEPRLVLVGGRDKLVHALHAKDGKVAWTFPTKSGIDGSPTIVGARAIVGGQDGNLYLLDLATGKEAWKFAAGSSFTGSPAVAAGKLVIASEDGLVYCFELEP